jgi:1-acyl-sn-glycerol-3-phosphate acyltransferase
VRPVEAIGPQNNDAVAIIGIGCRFPGGADSPDAFWELLKDGFNAVKEIPQNRTGFHELFDADPKKPGRTYSRWGGFLERIDLFDAQFFGIAPREAVHIDPQHRLLLELVWEACEDAGIPPPELAGSRMGVFVGISTHDYGDMQMYPQHRGEIDMHTNSGTATSIAANRISYLYDLRGPSVAIDTACSSSLSAVHFACQSLRNGDCSMAVAGGVQLLLAPELSIGFCKASMLSKDGECRAFDASANGYVRSEGAGVVLLKPLKDALAAGDTVYAVIRATAVNQDGHTHGMTVPSPAAQQAMIEEALGKAGIEPRNVQYIETHGTGTQVGDPIEASAVGAAMSTGRDAANPCAIGSVKTNLGHLEAASGMPGLIKVALALQHRQLPGSVHFHEANPAIDLSTLKLRVVTKLEPWPESEGLPVAGVNSFGFGGANAHVVLEGVAPPHAAEAEQTGMARLLTISAKTPEALKSQAIAYADDLRSSGDTGSAIRDICHTANERRAHHDCRLAITASNKEDLAASLEDFISGTASPKITHGRLQAASEARLAFVFAGMGPQWWGMGRQLRANEPAFRATLERCDEILRPYAGWSLLEEFSRDEASSRVALPELAQVTNFAIQVALSDLWASRGIKPDAVIGHSGGAMAAAYIAGVYSLEDALRLSFHRSRLQGRPANSGGMLAVGAPFEEIKPMLAGKEHLVSLAAVNGPSAITLAGDRDTIDELHAAMQEQRIFARILAVTIAYHSPAMDKIKDEFLASVPGLHGRLATTPFLSDTTGTWARGDECDVNYWWRAIRQPVLFHKGIEEMLHAGITNFVEISPHPVLVSSILESMKSHGVKGLVVPSIRRMEDERAAMLRSLGALYTMGRTPEWSALREDGARLVRLPRYAWQRERHWFEPSAGLHSATNFIERKAGDHPLLGARLRSARPVWENAAGTGATEYLQEHIVQGSAVYPGAAYVEMALAARRSMDPGSRVAVHDIEFLKPLVVSRDAGTAIQFAFDREDGGFEVFSSTASDGAAWTLHSHGKATVKKGGRLSAVDLDAARTRIHTPVDNDDFYEAMAQRGLNYGPAFRGIDKLWAIDGEALGFIALKDPLNCADYSVHPALLDAAFQVIVAAADSDTASRRLFLPTKIRELSFHAPPRERFWVIAKVTEATPVAVTAELTIVAEDGTTCIEIEGFTARLVDAAGYGAQDSIDNWLYEYRWEPAVSLATKEALAGHLPSETECMAIRERANQRSAETEWRTYYSEVETRLNELTAAYIAEARISIDAVLAGSWRHALATQCLEILNLVKPSRSAATLAERLLLDFPRHQLDVELLELCGPRLADVVAGRADGHDVLFSATALPLLERFYRESPASAFYNALMAERVADFASNFSAARPLRILEVGAGTGGTTSMVLPLLDPEATDYVFSDVSPIFLERAQAKFVADYPFLTTQIFDVTKDLALSGLKPGFFDLILAANVLHATPQVEPCTARLRELLAPGGALMLLEITRHPLWLDIVFGQIDGWWKFEDRDRRPHHPLMTGDKWCDLLAECGFESPMAIADSAPGEAAQSIIVAGRGIEKIVTGTKRWLLFADEGGVGRRLATALAEQSIDTELVYASDADLALWNTETVVKFDGIVHLWSLDAPLLSDSILDTSPFDEAAKLSCGSVLSILQRVVQGTSLAERGFVLVTAGAQAALAEEAPVLLQTPVWGLGRVIRKELPGLRCRMLDLSASPTPEEVLGLAREIARDGDGGDVWEEEVALRGNERFVRRLRPITLEGIAAAVPPIVAAPEDEWHAEMGATGSFDSIVFRRRERSRPGPLEVEVAIHAAGLNFRDVVLGMGAVSGLEAEDSYGSQRLGFDLAGTITSVGDDVSGLRVGDEVFGIARGAFASYAMANAALIVPRPEHITAEQASSVPVAFVTAHYSLRYLAQLAEGETVLIHVASGGVGVAAIQMAKRIGARIFATAGSHAKRQYVASLGVEAVMDSRSLSFAEEVLAMTGGRGVDVILNSLAGEAIDKGIAALAPYGRFIELGKSDIYQNRRLQLLPFKKNLSFFAVDLDRMCFERTEFVSKLLHEVAEELRSGLLEPPPCTEFLMEDLSGAMRFMAQAKHIGKVVVTNKTPVSVRDSVPATAPVHDHGTYLITGGMGGVGLLTARFLLDRGARNLALVGRAVPEDVDLKLADLRRDGINIQTLAADVSNADEVTRVVEIIRDTMPPLRGILHAAMVLADTALTELDEASMNAVMAPKILGAWNLHCQTLDTPLDFFVSFSSITSLLGNPLQGNYAAANTFLDAFATYRRARGLKATTINWGVIAGSGYVARHPEIEEALNRQGYQSFTEPQVTQVLSELLRHDAGQIMAARIDWRRLAEFGPKSAQSPRIRHLVPAAASEGLRPGLSSIRTKLEGEDASLRTTLLEQYLREQVARLLGAAPASIESTRAITDLGLDSLIATELTVVLERDLKVQIAGALLLSGISIHLLAGELAVMLWPASKSEELPVETVSIEPTASTDLPLRETETVPAAPELPPQIGTSRVEIVEPVPQSIEGHVDYSTLDYKTWTFGQQVVRKTTSVGFQLLAKIDAQGLENIPVSGPCILAVNHLSMADVPLVLTLLPRRAIILANDRLRQNKLIDWFVSDMGQAIYVKKNEAEEEPLQRALEVLRAGGLLALAPEGTRSKTGGLLRGNTGVAYLATHADVPVVPLVAWGQEKWRDRGRRIARIPIHVRVGAPMSFPQGPAAPPVLRRYTDQIMTALAAMLPAEYRGVYGRDEQIAELLELTSSGRER